MSLSGVYPADGHFHLLYSSVKIMGQRQIYIFQKKSPEKSFKIGVVRLELVLSRIYCTPRCYQTGGWEVGVCNSYHASYLMEAGGPTSFDLSAVQILDQLLVLSLRE